MREVVGSSPTATTIIPVEPILVKLLDCRIYQLNSEGSLACTPDSDATNFTAVYYLNLRSLFPVGASYHRSDDAGA